MGAKDTPVKADNTVDYQLGSILPSDKLWYRQTHLLKLNFIILSLVLFAFANGYDGSLINGL
ncbi:uncharacterized protein BKA55DRAFT_583153 [Fusarium redolens]|uniref:Uncharacterized protein n=1 Tax=Fusarium redolens TaxID=48865 RepID=A0A9P9G284_FUSRE|nr:uncharacterized protein BKA55DRAFT_583153 [Fusarium redolens]KAH7230627.1 hypothetical protein BKA55DRAFT_583153 [Fusarium redolens]